MIEDGYIIEPELQSALGANAGDEFVCGHVIFSEIVVEESDRRQLIHQYQKMLALVVWITYLIRLHRRTIGNGLSYVASDGKCRRVGLGRESAEVLAPDLAPPFNIHYGEQHVGTTKQFKSILCLAVLEIAKVSNIFEL